MLGEKLRYDAERWLATAIYDARGNFVGTFDPRLDSLRDVNYTDAAIDARRLHRQPRPQVDPRARGAGALLAVPRLSRGPQPRRRRSIRSASTSPASSRSRYSTLRRSIAAQAPEPRRRRLDAAMQFVRVIYNTPPQRRRRRAHQAQAQARRVVAGARRLSRADRAAATTRPEAVGRQPPLAGAAHRRLAAARRRDDEPRRVRQGGQGPLRRRAVRARLRRQQPDHPAAGQRRLNEVRLDRWRYITEVRARICAEKLITDEAEQKQVVFDLVAMAGGPPDPQDQAQAAGGARRATRRRWPSARRPIRSSAPTR